MLKKVLKHLIIGIVTAIVVLAVIGVSSIMVLTYQNTENHEIFHMTHSELPIKK